MIHRRKRYALPSGNALYRRCEFGWLVYCLYAPLQLHDLCAAIDMRTNSPRNALAFLGDKLQVGAYRC